MRNSLPFGIIISIVCSATAIGAPPLSESPESDIGYPTVEAAMIGLRKQSGIQFSTQNNWVIATDEANYTVWSFAPRDYPAYPAVVRRSVVSEGNATKIEMKVHCEASKEACDDLVRTFAQMNGLRLDE